MTSDASGAVDGRWTDFRWDTSCEPVGVGIRAGNNRPLRDCMEIRLVSADTACFDDALWVPEGQRGFALMETQEAEILLGDDDTLTQLGFAAAASIGGRYAATSLTDDRGRELAPVVVARAGRIERVFDAARDSVGYGPVLIEEEAEDLLTNWGESPLAQSTSLELIARVMGVRLSKRSLFREPHPVYALEEPVGEAPHPIRCDESTRLRGPRRRRPVLAESGIVHVLSGTVWLVALPRHPGGVAGDDLTFTGHWQLDARSGVTEDHPAPFQDASAAIAWGRSRAPRVIIQILGVGFFSAGSERIRDIPEWPP